MHIFFSAGAMSAAAPPVDPAGGFDASTCQRTLDPATASLHAAAAAGDVNAVRATLAASADAAAQDVTTGRSALHLAAAAGSEPCVTALLQAGAPWNAVDREGACPGDLANAAGATGAAAALFAHAVRCELLLGLLAEDGGDDPDAGDGGYLNSTAEFDATGDTLTDAAGRGVMMAWEAPLMTAHASLSAKGAAAGPELNVGHGLGLFDEALASALSSTEGGACPATHVICEAHPTVLARMEERKWDERTTIVAGRWQDALTDGRLLAAAGGRPFGSIFFATFDDNGLTTFFDALPTLLARDGVASFFNGCAADNPFFHAVACETIRLRLASAGLSCEFVPLPSPPPPPLMKRGRASPTSTGSWRRTACPSSRGRRIELFFY